MHRLRVVVGHAEKSLVIAFNLRYNLSFAAPPKSLLMGRATLPGAKLFQNALDLHPGGHQTHLKFALKSTAQAVLEGKR
jgi:hypothetical protein